ncbi:pentatricopeptide repeat-containing protein At3g51320 [Malania oleifera]|uniref:pentatricopeptide repeat-containing protein At3g51320 n=1 Tax=Malania oleifera TaxID=397392 RepID=UPI0025AE5FDC|nr:pentatricopeptide repeat-containing protein At3g51320 [Malania oleifera]XP_057957431.1 pentatricopeptide repeat-containing protein At3g51320 [Malania oleifera]XP_057957432.1 pentatricopeptide repeat-containing protein At3g51320 [Malania oleifera]XP_057957433.1 pentatricopeptide repeat-containing protein At3g51320 [Malania oleifera]XP_057957434.1 pentatricopeptide repeat-containing protein At3g51320 [Malania oleifera]
MARISIRGTSHIRNLFLSHPTALPSRCALYSSAFSSSSSKDSTTCLYHSIVALFKTCQNTRHLFQIQAHLITSGLFLNPFLAARVLQHSADYCDINYTVLVFGFIELPHTYCINTLIKAYSVSDVPHEAVSSYFEMLRNGFFPNSFTYPPLISSCAKDGRLENGKKCHGQAIKNGVDDVLPVCNSLIHMYSSCGDVETAVQMFDRMSQRDLVSWNSIVDGHARFGDLSVARRLFGAMPQRNVISWNIMIVGYLRDGNPGCGLKLFRGMTNKGMRGNDTTMVSVLTACGRSARLKEGRSVHGALVRTLLKSSLIVNTALIDMYSKCRRVSVAQKVFDGMIERNLVCWNAMILGHCIHGNPEDGLNLFAEMVDRLRYVDEDGMIDFPKAMNSDKGGVFPDEITFVGVLCSCARAGLLIRGKNYFSQMINQFCIKPTFAHYWCMANLFAGVGLIQEAVETLKSMPLDDANASQQSTIWAGLLGLCRFQGYVTLGEQIAKSLIKLEPQNLSYYALLLNIYAVAGQWDDVARVKEIMKVKGFGEMPGCSLMDLKKIVHEFKVGDRWQMGVEEVGMVINTLAQRLNSSTTGSQPQPLLETQVKS